LLKAFDPPSTYSKLFKWGETDQKHIQEKTRQKEGERGKRGEAEERGRESEERKERRTGSR
jgi:hypothetical protein